MRVYSLSLSLGDIVLTIPNLVRSHVIYRPTSNSAISAASSKPAPTERAAASVSHSPTTEAPTPTAQQDSVETLPLPNPPFTTASSTLISRPCHATMGITLLTLLRKFFISSPLPSSPLLSSSIYTEGYHPFHSMSFHFIPFHSISFHPHLFTALTIDCHDYRQTGGGGLNGATGDAGDNNCYPCNGGPVLGSIGGACGNLTVGTEAIYARGF